MRRKLIVPILVFQMTAVFSHGTVLDDYIQRALQENLALQQKSFSLQQSMAALKEARGLFLPSLSVEARYSRAGGGRKIEIPVGDLMNPVYATLNQLLSQTGQPAVFPEGIPNVSEPFLREKEHETKIRVIQPVFQPEIYYNYRIHQKLKKMEEFSKTVYIRQLVADVKTAYYNYLKTVQIGKLLDETEFLLQENLRISRSLYHNDKVTQAAVYRAEAELHAFHQQQAEADKHLHLAAAYFNFLLNRPLDKAIILTDSLQGDQTDRMQMKEATAGAIHRREELKQIREAVELAGDKIGLSCSKFLPGIAAVLDYGYQGETYRFGPVDDYWMASFVASWNLFNGFQDKYQIDQNRLQRKRIQIQLQEAESRIQMQVQDCHYRLNVARKNIETAAARRKAARNSFHIVDRLYKEGMASQIEFIDARSTQTEAEVNAIVANYDYQINLAEFEKVTAGYPIRN